MIENKGTEVHIKQFIRADKTPALMIILTQTCFSVNAMIQIVSYNKSDLVGIQHEVRNRTQWSMVPWFKCNI